MQAQKLSAECNVADPGQQPASPPSGEPGPFELDWRAAEFTADTAGAGASDMREKLREVGVLDAEAATPREAAWEAAWESASPRQAEE
jgi:hypothetical protein